MIMWFTGVSGSGKTTLSDMLAQTLKEKGYSVHMVDGDAFRKKEKRENTFSRQEIIDNNLRIIEHVKSLVGEYDVVIVSVISPFRETRDKAREALGQGYKEIFLDCPREVLIARDPKGLYAKALRGELPNLIGFSPQSPYERPEKPNLVIQTDKVEVDNAVGIIMNSFFKEMHNLNNEKKVILIADYGRSGQGWLSYMLCYLLNAKYIEPYYFLSGALYTENKALRDITSGDLPGREKTAYSMVIKTHELPAANLDLTDKVIFLMRDPRDVAISAYFMYRVTIKEDSNKSLKNNIFYLIHRFKLTSFMHTALKWRTFFRTWTARKDVPLYSVRYEDLLTETEKTLRGILSYLKVNVPDSLLQEAIQTFSFENLSGRKRGEEDNANPTFRKGVIGDYKNHFSKIDRMLFRRICGKEMGTLGYKF